MIDPQARMVFHQRLASKSRPPSARARQNPFAPFERAGRPRGQIDVVRRGPDGLDAAIAYRDGLLVGFLALIPMRRRNLADLVLDKTLLRGGSSWIVAFGDDATKTRAAFEIGLPDVLRRPSKHTCRPPTGSEGEPDAGPVLPRPRSGFPKTARR